MPLLLIVTGSAPSALNMSATSCPSGKRGVIAVVQLVVIGKDARLHAPARPRLVCVPHLHQTLMERAGRGLVVILDERELGRRADGSEQQRRGSERGARHERSACDHG